MGWASSIIVLDYQGLTVGFTETAWFNATAAAERFGRRVDHYLANAETKDYIATLCELENTRKVGDFVKTKRGRNGGTWLHPDLAVHFARWLDTRFSIWCDRQIRAIVSGTHPHYDRCRARDRQACAYRVMTETLRLSRTAEGKETDHRHYMTETKLVNWALAGEFRTLDRDALTADELALLASLEEHNLVWLGLGVDYADRKTMLEQHATEWRSGRRARLGEAG